MAFPMMLQKGNKNGNGSGSEQSYNTEDDPKIFNEALLLNLGYNSYFKNLIMSADPGLLGGNIKGKVFTQNGYTQAETFFRDPQVTAAFNAFALPILKKKPHFVANTDDQKSQDLAGFFNWTLSKFEGSSIQLMYDIITSKYFSNSKIEKRYALMDQGTYKNKYYYTSFHKKRSGLWDFVYDEETNTKIVGVVSLVDPSRTVYPLEKFIVSYGLMLDDNPNGQGDYERVAKFIIAKNEILVFMLALGAKQSNAKLPVLTTKTGTKNAISTLKEIFRKVREGLGIALPPGFELALHDYKTDNLEWFINVLKWLDSQIALAIIGNSTSINESQGAGTNAQSQVHAQYGTEAMIKLWENLVREIFIEQYMKPLIKLNYDPNVYTEDFYPEFTLIDTTEKDKKAIVEWLKLAQEAEIADYTTETDLKFARQELELPENDEILERVKLLNNNALDKSNPDYQKIIQLVQKMESYGKSTADIINEFETILEETIQAA